ncbi:PDDEXK family nuclease [Pseudomonas fildesensis]|uniref:Uncharacterized protein n=1 Tax=Pseudomonas fildesensis TaxID=1674920 RepID=A0A0J8G238_9PSED|nr:hypothetical protein [Pseudomonas fildesensis]KMT56572.1 hypothetical protein ACR52_06180 [Pseudomonas fildesensis]
MISQKTLTRIRNRQGNFRWGDDYLPAIFAVPGEAPKGSRVCRLNSRKLERALHLLSIPERVFTQLALFHPAVFDIHEQKLLHPQAHVHPLHGHPLAQGASLKPLAGTLAIANHIGMDHAKVVVETSSGERKWAAYPYLGDLLIYLNAPGAAPYAVNWNIKLSKYDFMEKRRSSLKSLATRRKDRQLAELRLRLEEEYYLSAGIRTVNLSLDEIDPIVVANLDQVFGAHDRPLDLNPQLLEDFSQQVHNDFICGRPLAPVAIAFGKKWGNRDQFLARIYQDIWDRNLAVDLFQYIQIDQPLEHARYDVIEHYRSFFSETAQ